MVGRRSLQGERGTTDLRQVSNLGGSRLREGCGGRRRLGEDRNHCKAGRIEDGRRKETGAQGLYTQVEPTSGTSTGRTRNLYTADRPQVSLALGRLSPNTKHNAVLLGHEGEFKSVCGRINTAHQIF